MDRLPHVLHRRAAEVGAFLRGKARTPRRHGLRIIGLRCFGSCPITVMHHNHLSSFACFFLSSSSAAHVPERAQGVLRLQQLLLISEDAAQPILKQLLLLLRGVPIHLLDVVPRGKLRDDRVVLLEPRGLGATVHAGELVLLRTKHLVRQRLLDCFTGGGGFRRRRQRLLRLLAPPCGQLRQRVNQLGCDRPILVLLPGR